MVVPNLRFSAGIALAGLAQFREEEICKPQVGGSIPLASSTTSADLGLQLGDSGNKQIENIPVLTRAFLAFRYKLNGDFEQG